MATIPMAAQISPGRMAAGDVALAHMRSADSAFDAKNQEKLKRLYVQMAKMPWSPASIVSLHAYPLHSQNPLLNELRLMAAPLATDERFPKIALKSGRKLGYTHHVFPNWGRNLVPNDAGEIEPSAILPIDLALDFVAQYVGTNPGGVFCYEGTAAPELCPPETLAYVQGDRSGKTRGLSMPFLDAVEYVHDLQIKHYSWWYGEANEAWNGTDDAKRNIIGRSNVIKMVGMLRAWGELAIDPPWLKSPLKRAASTPTICKSCGAESKPGALKCTNGSCTYVFHPFKAFADLVIDLDTPGAGLALRRLQTAQVEQLIRWKRFTREEVEAAGYRFAKKGAKAQAPFEVASEGDVEPGEEDTTGEAEPKAE